MKADNRSLAVLLAVTLGASVLDACGSAEHDAATPGQVQKQSDTAMSQQPRVPAAATPPAPTPIVPMPSVEETRAIAEAGFIYGLPIVMNYAVMYEYAVDTKSSQFKAPFNQIRNEARVFTYEDTSVVTPNSDTPYSILWTDLRAEPIVISVPAVEKDRYYSVMIEDGNTYIVGYIGSRATGNEAGTYMITSPDWKGGTPPGIKQAFRSTTQFAPVAYRTQLFDPADMDKVKAIQAGYTVQPLSAFLKKPAPPAAPAVDFPPIDKESAKTRFFEYLDFCLQFAPLGQEELTVRSNLGKIGVGSGHFEMKALSPEHQAALFAGMKAGEEKVTKYVTEGSKHVNGWGIGSWFGDRLFYGGNWLKRAAGAQAGIYGNAAEEATYPMTKTLANGEPLDGSQHDYTLTFAADQFPPVNAFWSVTMYDGKTQLLIKNPINRYLINSPMLPQMKLGADGSLTIYIQKDSPGKDKESNWLPAPNGPIYLVMRLYWPKTGEVSILPAGEGTWKPPALVVGK